jgi:hypothetical protein
MSNTTEISRRPDGSVDTEFYMKQGRLERGRQNAALLARFGGFLKGLAAKPEAETVPAFTAIDGTPKIRLSRVPGDADIEQREAA